MTLKLFDKIKDLDDNKLHPKFKFLRDDPSVSGEKEIIKLWTEGFVDRDNKIVKEFQTSFHSALWEFFLFAMMKKFKYEIDFSHNRPDFIISKPDPMYIEAVVSEIKKDGKPESNRTIDDILSMARPFSDKEEFAAIIDEAIVRHSNSFLFKEKKYFDYLKEQWMDNSVPYVIAISSYDQINYGKEFYYSMMALLYGMYYDLETENFSQKTEILKPGTQSPIPIGLFADNQHQEISAVIFSCTLTLGKLTALAKSDGTALSPNSVMQIKLDDGPIYRVKDINKDCPEELEDGVFVFYNPFAKNPLNKNIFDNSSVVQIRNHNNIRSNDMPMVSRFNCFIPEKIKEDFYISVMDSFNPGFGVYSIEKINLNNIILRNDETSEKICVNIDGKIQKKINDESVSEGDVLYALIDRKDESSPFLKKFLKL